MKLKFKFLLVTVIVASSLALIYAFNNHEPSEYEGLAIAKITGLSDKVYAEISSSMATEVSTSIEYACVESGIVVVKIINSSLQDKADNSVMIRNQLSKAAGQLNIEIIYIDIRSRKGSSKC